MESALVAEGDVCMFQWNEDLLPLFLKKALNAIFENQYRVMTRHVHQFYLFLQSKASRGYLFPITCKGGRRQLNPLFLLLLEQPYRFSAF